MGSERGTVGGARILNPPHARENGWTADAFIKRLFDVCLAGVGLVLLSPVLLFLSIAIQRHDKGPVFYRGVRVGRGGVPFKMFKFRTMVVNAEQLGGSSTADDDKRITNIGRFMRKYKLDELPQLINVLRGEMSFVGPRPEVLHYVNMFSEEERAILTVRPGITDWASLWNSDEGALLAGSADPEKTYMEKIRPEKIRLQLKYVREQSFCTDLAILFQTVMTILPFGRRGCTHKPVISANSSKAPLHETEVRSSGS